MRLPLAALATLCALSGGCSGAETSDIAQTKTEAAARDQNGADTMASHDGAPSGETITDPQQRPVMQMQVVLERLGFAPGVIDGKQGASLANALKGFQEARNLPVTGELDAATRTALAEWSSIPATRVVTIPQEWGQIAFATLPENPADQAKLKALAYESLIEKLSERFHTIPDVLARLNPGGQPAGTGGAAATQTTAILALPAFAPGQTIRVPNVGADRIDAVTVDNKDWLETLRSLGVGTDQPAAARLAVDESEGWLKAYDAADKLVAMFTVTTGSQHDPLPIGNWGIKGKAYNPPYAYDPALLRNAPASNGKHQLPPGPNSPVGVVWIDLTKDHYGLHGTPSPETIGRAQSNGCVRLTNWDAARLAQMVGGSTKVEFRK